MDYSKFQLEDFDCKEWINNLIQMTSSDTIEKDLTNIVIKLQFFMEEMNSIVDESTQTAFQSLPRIVREIENVRQEAAILQEQMSLIKNDIEKVEKSTQDSMCKLLKIDARKMKLSQVENALQEANSWSQICENIDHIMKSGDLTKIADKIASLQHSLSMLSSTPDFIDRQKKVQNLCDHFESILGPQLIQAFFNNDSQFILLGLDLLNKIDRKEYGSKYYSAWFKPSVQEIWINSKNSTQWENAEYLIKLFFDNLIMFCNQELDKDSFVNNGSVLITSLTDALGNLEEQFDKLLGKEALQPLAVNRRINILVNCIQVTDTFCEQLESSLQMKSSDIQSIDAVIVNRLSEVLYSQYKGIDEIFSRECETYVQQKLNNIKMDSVDVVDSIDILDESIDSILELARDCVRYCKDMTHFTSIETLANCIKNLFINYTREFKRVCINIILKLSNQQTLSADRSDNMDSGIDDYYFLQDGIKLTSLGGHISIHFEIFLQEMLNEIINYIQKLYSPRMKSNIFLRQYPIILTDNPEKRDQITELWKQISNVDSQIQLLKFSYFACIEETRKYTKFKLLRWLNRKVFENAIEPVKKSVCNLYKLSVWTEELETGEALPQFAFSPQEYITKIGQFFMTLPQQLEPFFSNNNKYYQESLVNGQLPHMSSTFFNNWLMTDNSETQRDNSTQSNTIQVAHVWLESLVTGSIVQIVDQWMNIPKLSVNGKLQLQADINYIIGVIEDLDLVILQDLSMFSKLIAAVNKDDIAEICSTYNISGKIVETVERMIL